MGIFLTNIKVDLYGFVSASLVSGNFWERGVRDVPWWSIFGIHAPSSKALEMKHSSGECRSGLMQQFPVLTM